MIDNNSSSSKTNEAKLSEHLKKFPIWEFECIDRVCYQKFTKEQKSDILARYYYAMRGRFDSVLCFFVVFICFWAKKCFW